MRETQETINIHIQSDPLSVNETKQETFNRYQNYIKVLDNELKNAYDEYKYIEFVTYKTYVAKLRLEI